MKKLLRAALPGVSQNQLETGPGRDLWPEVVRRLEAGSARLPWFDWALIVGLAAFAVFFPSVIPVFLYYL